MTNAKWSSADANGGWMNHYAQMLRWRDRALEELKIGEGIESLDFSLAFFLWCFSLRDWLKKDGARTEQQLANLVSANSSWKYCRDVALRTKHYEPSRPSIDANYGISREYDCFSAQIQQTERADWNIWIDGKKLRLADVIRDLSDMWMKELQHELPSGRSTDAIPT